LLKEVNIKRADIRFSDCKDLSYFITKYSYKDILKQARVLTGNKFLNSLVVDPDNSL